MSDDDLNYYKAEVLISKRLRKPKANSESWDEKQYKRTASKFSTSKDNYFEYLNKKEEIEFIK